jgi:hypothetical protein
MSENNRSSNPIQVAVVVLLLVGGGWYFLQHYEIGGLDGVTVNPRNSLEDDATYITYHDAPAITASDVLLNRSSVRESIPTENPFSRKRIAAVRGPQESSLAPQRGYASVRIVSWALDGFGPTKLANSIARTNVARVIRQFDVVAIQQLASIERDLVPRLVESINHGDRRYDFVMGEATGPADRQEHLAFIFDTTRVLVDRRQTYTVDDPGNKMTFDPLVAWFRAAEPPSTQAWTFSLVNVRVDLARAPNELALLPEMLASIRSDGRGEDDIVLAGLFQADDAYLLPTIAGQNFKAAIHNRPTDIFGRFQTSNLLVDAALTSEYLGRGGVFDFLRHYELNLAEAEAVTSHLPVYAEFTATEGGNL